MTLVTGEKPSEEQVDLMIETGEGETIFKKAIMESGRGQVMVAKTTAFLRGRGRCNDG